MLKNHLVLVLLLASYILTAQVTGNIQFRGQQISSRQQYPTAVFQNDQSNLVDINAIINVEADAYVAVFNVSQTAPDIEQVQQLTDERIQRVRQALSAVSGVHETFVDMLSLVPVYELEVEKKIFSKNTYDELPRGFELQKNIHVRYQDPNLLDQLILICGREEIYDLVKVDYYVENFQSYYDTLRTACYQFLDSRLTEYRERGIQLDTSRALISESSNYSQPVDSYEEYSAFITNSFQGKAQNKTVQRQRKKVTQYYQPITYKGYDIVMHPEIVQPVLQFTFNLKAKYFLTSPAAPKKDIYILTPEGNLKQVSLE